MWLLVLFSVFLIIASPVLVRASVIGGEFEYSIEKGDTLDRIAAKLGVPAKRIVDANGIDPKKPLSIGRKLKVFDRKIVPMAMDEGIVVNIPERRLYFFKDKRLAETFPVALGLSRKANGFDWRTPIGKFVITAREKDPTWLVPPSIQEEMAREGKEVLVSVPPGPDNPLGRYALKTSLPGILLHETNKPASISRFASHGCIRIHPDHMAKLFPEVRRNTPGEIIYMPVKVFLAENDRVFVEINDDAYGRLKNIRYETVKKLQDASVAGRVDWQKIERLLKEKTGIAEDVTL
ncbi:MAG TPA: L,D-transpeptidase family protein [Dissulfurispiraceae bacterium]|nr:L,D-transpeptidase family protein [Dissulfurispiraceae bacterium]